MSRAPRTERPLTFRGAWGRGLAAVDACQDGGFRVRWNAGQEPVSDHTERKDVDGGGEIRRCPRQLGGDIRRRAGDGSRARELGRARTRPAREGVRLSDRRRWRPEAEATERICTSTFRHHRTLAPSSLSASEHPSTSSITRYTKPSFATPVSTTETTLGWRARVASWASRASRASARPWASRATFSASRRWSCSRSTSYTVPMPPAPRAPMMRYRSSITSRGSNPGDAPVEDAPARAARMCPDLRATCCRSSSLSASISACRSWRSRILFVSEAFRSTD